SLAEFPAWFFNLPPPNDSWPGPEDRPPGATTRLRVSGFLSTKQAGTLRVETSNDMASALSVDGGPAVAEAALTPGTHLIVVDSTLTGERWQFVPTWNGLDLWSWRSPVVTTTAPPPEADVRLRAWVRAIPTLVASILLVAWIAAAVRSVGEPRAVVWCALASAVIAALVLTDRVDTARWGIAALTAAALVPVGDANRNRRGAF